MDGGGVSLASDTHDWMLVLEGDAGGAVHIAFAGNLGQGREPSFGRFGSPQLDCGRRGHSSRFGLVFPRHCGFSRVD